MHHDAIPIALIINTSLLEEEVIVKVSTLLRTYTYVRIDRVEIVSFCCVPAKTH